MITRRDLFASAGALMANAALPSASGAGAVAIECMDANGLRMGEGVFLVMEHRDPALNGVYRVSAGTWERCGD